MLTAAAAGCSAPCVTAHAQFKHSRASVQLLKRGTAAHGRAQSRARGGAVIVKAGLLDMLSFRKKDEGFSSSTAADGTKEAFGGLGASIRYTELSFRRAGSLGTCAAALGQAQRAPHLRLDPERRGAIPVPPHAAREGARNRRTRTGSMLPSLGSFLQVRCPGLQGGALNCGGKDNKYSLAPVGPTLRRSAGVYDGHMGSSCSKFLRDNMHISLERIISKASPEHSKRVSHSPGP